MTILTAFLLAGFSFQGTEIVGIASGESEHPETAVPKAINAVFWRILIFYIGAVAVIGFLLHTQMKTWRQQDSITWHAARSHWYSREPDWRSPLPS